MRRILIPTISRHRALWIFAAAIFSAFTSLPAQQADSVVLNTCDNLGFEKGTFEGWRGVYGTTRDEGNELIYENIQYGFERGRHTIVSLANGFDPIIKRERIPVVGFGQYAVRLGNAEIYSQFDRLITSFRVTKSNTLFVYKFAVVMEDPQHEPIQQPKFEVEVFNAQKEILDCGFYVVAAARDIPGFKSQDEIRYRNWTTAAIDLRQYIGQVITIQFTAYDCTEGGHYGYAYLDADCLTAKITATRYCPGIDSVITLSAPEGFASYRWSNGSVGRSITINKPRAHDRYTCTITPFSSLKANCTLEMEYIIPDKNDIQLLEEDTLQFCPKSDAIVEVQEPYFDNYSWTLGKNGPVVGSGLALTVQKPGLYYVRAQSGACVALDSFTVTNYPEPVISWQKVPPSCAGKQDGSLEVNSPDAAFLRYEWSTGASSPKIGQLGAGEYSLTVTDNRYGCPVRQSVQLVEAPPMELRLSAGRPIGCDGSGQGLAQVSVKGGKAPYVFAWSNGATGQSTAIAKEGAYEVEVRDVNGCLQRGSVHVGKVSLDVQTIPNNCAGERNGRIGVAIRGSGGGFLFRLNHQPYSSQAQFDKLAAGTYTVAAKDTSGCEITKTIELTDPFPFEILLPKEMLLDLGEDLTLSPESNQPIKSYSWLSPFTGGCTQCPVYQVAQVIQEGRVFLKGISEAGCLDSTSTLVRVRKDYSVYIPTAFSPNEDGINDLFKLFPGKSTRQILKLSIFDRWGGMVYNFDRRVEEGPPQWDGSNQGRPCNAQMYVYQALVEFIDGTEKLFSGGVLLVK